MAREFAISCYLVIFKILFNLFKMFPQKKKTTLVASFGDNVLFTAKSLEKLNNEQIVILKTSSCREDFSDLKTAAIQPFAISHFTSYILGIYHLATSKVIMVDNYFGFLAVTDFKPNVTCIQLWHAAGALKRFGLQDPSINTRSKKAQARFREVYQRFDYVTVGSEKMASIFRKSFGLDNNKILRTGIPRTDFFFDTESIKQIEQDLAEQYPIIKKRKVIMYAPTYRDDELQKPKMELDIKRMYEELGQEYVLFLRLHPAVTWDMANFYPNFVIDVTQYRNINPLLLVTDILITDYSSIPFEYALLNRPMLFFTYDLEKYQQTRGVSEEYLKSLPGKVVKDTRSITKAIKTNDFNLDRVYPFSRTWNKYSQGDASDVLIQAIYQSNMPTTNPLVQPRTSEG